MYIIISQTLAYSYQDISSKAANKQAYITKAET